MFKIKMIFFSGLNLMKFCSRVLHLHPRGSHASKTSNKMSAFSIICWIIFAECLTFLFWLINSLSFVTWVIVCWSSKSSSYILYGNSLLRFLFKTDFSNLFLAWIKICSFLCMDLCLRFSWLYLRLWFFCYLDIYK